MSDPSNFFATTPQQRMAMRSPKAQERMNVMGDILAGVLNVADVYPQTHLPTPKGTIQGRYVSMGPLASFPRLHAIEQAMFGGAGFVELPGVGMSVIQRVKEGTVARVSVGGFTHLQQNPNKPGSYYAQKAREGARIIWIIKQGDRDKGIPEQWIGKVENGTVWKKVME